MNALPRLALGMLASIALVSGLLVGCAPSPDPDPTSIAVKAGVDARIATPDEQLVVEIPGEAIEGSGELTVTPAITNDGATGWSVELTGGASLVGTATLSFAQEVAEVEPVPLVASTADGENFAFATDITTVDGRVVVQTTHFSSWFIVSWQKLLDGAKKLIDAVYRGSAARPSCTGEQAVLDAGYRVAADDSDLAYWCVGMDEAGTPTLKLANARGYAVAMEHTPGATVSDRGASDLILMLANLIKERPSKAGNTVTLAGAGDTISYSLTGTSDMAVRVRPSAPAYLLSAMQFAVDTLGMVLERLGKPTRSQKALGGLFTWESCITGLSSMATADIATGTQASTYFNDAVGTALGCLGDAIKKAGLAGWEVVFAAGMTWFISGVRTAINGFSAAADSALYLNGFTVQVTPPAPDRWLISSEGVGPATIDMNIADAEAALGTRGQLCTGPDQDWYVIAFTSADRAAGFLLLGEASSDTPATASGVTLGTTEHELTAAGWAPEQGTMGNYGNPLWTRTENGVAYRADLVPDTGTVYMLTVGDAYIYPDYC